jgi:hypothetical protein
MWRIPFLARLGGWLCLLGSVLALVAFFLPYWSSPPESLWHILVSVFLYYFLPFLPFQQPNMLFDIIAVNAAALLLLLPGNVLMVCAALLSGSDQRGSLPTYLKLPGLTLLGYIVVSLLTFSVAWLDAQDANQSTKGFAFIDTLTRLGIGAWLIPIGLLLALLGGILLMQKENKAGR